MCCIKIGCSQFVYPCVVKEEVSGHEWGGMHELVVDVQVKEIGEKATSMFCVADMYALRFNITSLLSGDFKGCAFVTGFGVALYQFEVALNKQRQPF